MEMGYRMKISRLNIVIFHESDIPPEEIMDSIDDYLCFQFKDSPDSYENEVSFVISSEDIV